MPVSPSPFHIRPYQTADREQVFRIAADTAYFGGPVEVYLDDRRLFCEAFYAYYTDLEPEHGWVAQADGSVAGFLMGSLNSRLQTRHWIQGILPGVIRHSLSGRYRIGIKTWRYLWSLLAAWLSAEQPPVDLDLYPAHLHVNVDPAWQGLGIGRSLMQAYLNQLRAAGVPGVHLHTTSANLNALRLYRNMGFAETGSRPNAFFTRMESTPVSNLCFARRVEADVTRLP